MPIQTNLSHKITALKMQKRNSDRINVFLDGEYAFGLARIVAAWLKVGQEITDKDIAELQTEDANEVAYQKALKYISYRPRTESEVHRYLAKQSKSDETIELTIERLKRSGLINDTEFALGWVESHATNRPKSKRALAYELRRRGIDDQIIAEGLERVNDEEMAYKAAIKHARRVEKIDIKTFRMKMYRYLSQRGFSYDISAPVISRVWEQSHNTNQSQDQEASS